MKTYLLLLACIVALLASCATNVPSSVAVRPPVRSEPVAPTAEKMRKEIVVVKETNKDIEAGLDAAINELSRLSKQKTASEKELDEMWDRLTNVQTNVAKQFKQIQESETTITDLNAKAIKSDIEKTELRLAIDDANAKLKAAKGWEDEAKPKVAVYDFFKGWAIRIGIFSGIGLGIFLAIRYLPQILARLRPAPL